MSGPTSGSWQNRIRQAPAFWTEGGQGENAAGVFLTLLGPQILQSEKNGLLILSPRAPGWMYICTDILKDVMQDSI